MDFIKIEGHLKRYRVLLPNDQILGTLESEQDGKLNFQPDPRRWGYWSAEMMRTIADKLDSLNK